MKKIRKTIHSAAYRGLLGKLRDLREQAGLNQRQLAARLGVPHSWVAKVELGERRLDLLEFLAILDSLGKDPLPLIKDLLVELPASRHS